MLNVVVCDDSPMETKVVVSMAIISLLCEMAVRPELQATLQNCGRLY